MEVNSEGNGGSGRKAALMVAVKGLVGTMRNSFHTPYKELQSTFGTAVQIKPVTSMYLSFPF